MNVEEAISSILTRCPNLTRQDVEKQIQERRTASGGLLTESSAARQVAAGYGVKIKLKRSTPKLYIKQLVSGLNNVTATGRVLAVGKPHSFSRRNGQGHVANLSIADKTGKIRVVLWDDKVELINRIHLGQVIRVEHSYVRKSKYGQNELHVGQRGNIQMTSDSCTEADFPQMERFEVHSLRIGDLREGTRIDTIHGIVKTEPNLKEITTRLGDKVLLASFELEDQTGKIRVSAWQEHARRIADLTVGSKVTFRNAHVKRGYGNQLEIVTRASTQIIT
ncbi:MAG: OB-fold nucleic acid binding domain-containing protein [Candidatus Bathyarchaeota archaeon]|nr:OB-fold nucleic acid binding domain-containing protein [Candidatus Bathyarchaeota archaeon]